MSDFVRYRVGDVVQLKKVHPCGMNEWEIMRIGIDYMPWLRSSRNDTAAEV